MDRHIDTVFQNGVLAVSWATKRFRYPGADNKVTLQSTVRVQTNRDSNPIEKVDHGELSRKAGHSVRAAVRFATPISGAL